jgi:hypothetical protein
VFMKSSVFWDLVPCSPLKVNWCFGGTCNLHLQSWRVSQCWRLTSYVPPERWLAINGLYGFIS